MVLGPFLRSPHRQHLKPQYEGRMGAACNQTPHPSSWRCLWILLLLRHRHLGYLHPGEYFGEYSCLLGQERSATVVASGYVELYSLSRADLELVLQQWPELAEQFEAMGEWKS